jgi:hemoglobin
MTIEMSLYERLGGSLAIRPVTEALYRRVLADEELAPYFKNADMGRLIAMQTAFLTMALGGPADYSGRDLRQAHAGLAGLSDHHFDRVVAHLAAALRDAGVSDADVGAAGAVAETVRKDVLNR